MYSRTPQHKGKRRRNQHGLVPLFRQRLARLAGATSMCLTKKDSRRIMSISSRYGSILRTSEKFAEIHHTEVQCDATLARLQKAHVYFQSKKRKGGVGATGLRSSSCRAGRSCNSTASSMHQSQTTFGPFLVCFSERKAGRHMRIISNHLSNLTLLTTPHPSACSARFSCLIFT